MNCREVKANIKAYVDGELGLVKRMQISQHIRRCVECRMEERAMTELTKQVENAQKFQSPEGLREKVLGETSFEPAARPRLRLPRLVSPTGVAVAALAVLTITVVVLPTFQQSKMRSVHTEGRSNIGISTKLKSPIPESSPPILSSLVEKKSIKRPVSAKPDYYNYPGSASAPQEAPIEQMIIKTADVSVEVKNVESAGDRAVVIVKLLGGYVSASSISKDKGTLSSGEIDIRVPVSSFERAMERLSALGKVTSKSISGEDVTTEVVDLQSRLRNKRAEEEQYLEIMNKAHRVQDIVTVSSELYRVRGEIEQTQGRIKYLKDAASMSTINLTLNEKQKPKTTQSQIHKSMTGALESFGRTMNSIAGLFIWLAVYSPFWVLPIGAALYFRKRYSAGEREASAEH